MDAGVWMHALIVLIAVDVAALTAGVAIVVDRRLVDRCGRRRFSLRSLLLLLGLTVINLGAIAGLLTA